jgi:hypothetical protein
MTTEGVASGDHMCCLYSGSTERNEIVLPYLREGLLALEKCVCVIDAEDPVAAFESLGADIDATKAAGDGQLEVVAAGDAYLRSGRFSAPEMEGFWKVAVSKVMNGGRFARLRAAGEMSGSLRGAPATEELIEFEASLTRLLPLYPQTILCLYDLDHFGGTMLIDLVKMHPKVYVNGRVLENPYYLLPAELMEQRTQAVRSDPRLETLVRIMDDGGGGGNGAPA